MENNEGDGGSARVGGWQIDGSINREGRMCSEETERKIVDGA